MSHLSGTSNMTTRVVFYCRFLPARKRCRFAYVARLLVVEDDADSAEALCAYLRQAGHTVDCKLDGKEALQAILDGTPDLVILDLYLPEMDGTSLLEVLRSYLRLQTLPVIVLTGLADSPMAERARSLKVNAILVKGRATPQDVLKAVEQELPRAPQ